MIKKFICAIFVSILVLGAAAFPAAAHSGRTDSQGGHTNHSTGEYHFHHGYSAHQHAGGICPYSFDDKTGSSSGSSSSGSSNGAAPALKKPSNATSLTDVAPKENNRFPWFWTCFAASAIIIVYRRTKHRNK